MFCRFAPRSPNCSIIEPTQSSGISICKSSQGSYLTPSISLIITLGLETWSSKPSRRIFSIKIPKCNSPRPDTKKLSLVAVSTFKLTSFCVSFNSLSSILRAVTNLPSRPTNGDVLAPNVICRVGSSICKTGSGKTFPCSQIVSPTDISASPAIATISPASAWSISTLL